MKVFISWSGEISRNLACILRAWLPQVIQKIEPYVSAKDIKNGELWFQSISKGLDDASYGIICVTRKNIASPWLNFEAGALFRTVSSTQRKICPLLLGVTPEDLGESPLRLLQAAQCEKEGMKSLLETLNEEAGHPISSMVLADSFDKWWPDLDKELKGLLKQTKPKIVWAFETEDLKVDDAIKEAEMAGFPIFKKWSLKHGNQPEKTKCDLLICVVSSAYDSGERLEKVVQFLESITPKPLLIIYATEHLGSFKMNIINSYTNRLMANFPKKLVNILKETSD